MHIQYINEMLDLLELTISQIRFFDRNELHIEALPVDHKKRCPLLQIVSSGHSQRHECPTKNPASSSV